MKSEAMMKSENEQLLEDLQGKSFVERAKAAADLQLQYGYPLGRDNNYPDRPSIYTFVVDGHELSCVEHPEFKVSVENTITKDNKNILKKIIIKHKSGTVIETVPSKLDDVYDKFKDAGVLNSFDLQPVVEYAIKLSNDLSKDYASTYHHMIGWHTIMGKDVCLLANAVGEINSTYRGDMKVTKMGTLDGWAEVVNEYIVNSDLSSTAMAASFAGLIRQRYSRLAVDTQLVINLVGASSRGKTTLTRACHSIYGDPREILNYSGTMNDRTKRFALRGCMVSSIDDILQMNEFKNCSTSNLGNKISSTIFQMASGESRSRLGQYGELQHKEVYQGTILTSSTKPMMAMTGKDDGQASRLIELKLTKDQIITKDATEAKAIDNAFDANHGHAAEKFAEGLLEMSEADIISMYDKIHDYFMSELSMSRQANRFSMIILCAELCNQFIGTKFDVESMSRYLISVGNKIHKSFSSIVEPIDAEEVEDLVADYLAKYPEFFHEGKLNKTSELENYLGIYDVVDEDHVFLRIPIFSEKKKIFNDEGDLLRRADVFPYIILGVEPEKILDTDNAYKLPNVPDNYHEVLSFLKERNILFFDGGKHKGRDTFVKGVQLHCVKVCIRLEGRTLTGNGGGSSNCVGDEKLQYEG